MDLIANGEVMYGGTYNSNPIVTSAVMATLDELGQPGVYLEMNRRGERLADGLVEICRSAGLPAAWSGVGAMFQIWFCEEGQLPKDYRESIPLQQSSPFGILWRVLLERGVLVQPKQGNLFLLSTAHTDADIDFTLQAAEDAIASIKIM
jgi:glutamate-1-semialdehyde 2,1-aminomutase